MVNQNNLELSQTSAFPSNYQNGGAKKKSKPSKKSSKKNKNVDALNMTGGKKKSSKKTSKKTSKYTDDEMYGGAKKRSKKTSKKSSKKTSKKNMKGGKDMPPAMKKHQEFRKYVQDELKAKGGVPMVVLAASYIKEAQGPEKKVDLDDAIKAAKEKFQKELKSGEAMKKYDKIVSDRAAKSKSKKDSKSEQSRQKKKSKK